MKKRIFSILLVLFLLCGAIPNVSAATMSSFAGAVTTSWDPINVRSGASTGYPVVATVPKGSHITLLSRNGNWWYVEYGNNRFGYCHADYITPIEGIPARVTAKSGLNVRSGRSTAYSINDILYYNQVIVVLNTENGWSRILYHGTKTGYVSSQYLSGNTATPPQSSGNVAVSLNVPNFKQYDSRWGNITIGASGKTFSQIGCATTAISMMESFRTGSVIYPHNMAKNLRYTPDGSVYWPSHYRITTDSSNYLGQIYKILKNGKPVLLGAKNAAGKQHWVVITGFTGGALSPANFTVHDPGSQTRSNLQLFLNAYPVFYKYFSY